MEGPGSAERLRFGPFEVDLRDRELLRQGVRVPLQGQPFEILVALLESPGALVPREALQRRLWPEGTFVEFDQGLNTAVRKLREALGDDPRAPHFIETRARLGYRFVGAVETPPAHDAAVGVQPPAGEREAGMSPAASETGGAATDSRGGIGRRLVWMAAGALVLAVAAALLLDGEEKQARKRSAAAGSFAATRIVGRSDAAFGSIAPDGSAVAYFTVDNALWVRRLPDGGEIRLREPSAENCFALEFSPRGDRLYYSCTAPEDPRRGLLFEQPLFGGAERVVTAGVNGAPAFSPDGGRFAIKRYEAEPDRHALLELDLSGAVLRTLFTAPATWHSIWSYDWSPDGSAIAWISREEQPAGEALWSVRIHPLEGSEERIALAPDPAPVRAVRWDARGAGLYLIRTWPGERNQIWHLDLESGDLGRVSRDDNDYRWGLGRTGDGASLLATSYQRASHLWVASLAGAGESRLLASGVGAFEALAWGGGGEIVYSAITSDGSDLFAVDEDDGAPRRLTFGAGSKSYPAVVGPSGGIVFLARQSGNASLRLRAGDPPRTSQLVRSGASPAVPMPDGSSILYVTTGPARSEIRRLALPEGPESSIRSLDLALTGVLAVSRDGNRLAYLYREPSSSGERLRVEEIESGERVADAAVDHGFGPIVFAADGSAVLYARNEELLELSLSDLEERVVLRAGQEIYWFDLAPDGERLAYVAGLGVRNLVRLERVDAASE